MAVQRDFEDDGGRPASDGAGPLAVVEGGRRRHDDDAASRAQHRLERAFAEAAQFPAKVFSTALINSLANLDSEGLGFEQSVDLLESVDMLASAVEALKARAVSRVSKTAVERVNEENLHASGPDVQRLADGVRRTEIAALLNLSSVPTSRLISESESLTDEMPATLNALEVGRISRGQAATIIDQCGTIPKEAVGELEAELAAFAPGRSRDSLSRKGRRLREEMHPESIRKRKAKAARDRTVLLEGAEDGMAWLSTYLPAEAATAAFNRVTAVAKQLQGPDEPRNKAQLRADIVADLLHSGTGTGRPPVALNGISPAATGAKGEDTAVGGRNATRAGMNLWAGGAGGVATNSNGDRSLSVGQIVGAAAAAAMTGCGTMPAPGTVPDNTAASNASADGDGGQLVGGNPVHVGSGRIPDYEGIKAEVMVVVPVLTLMGLSDEPTDLEGFGPIDEDTARRLAARAPSFKRILTHPETGALLSYGKDSYKVPADLKRVVKLRDRVCRGPGCNKAARTCDLDHTVPYPRGRTDEWNLKGLCKPTHILKTAGLWRDQQHRNGRVDWTSPGGKHYSNMPEGPLPDMRPIGSIDEILKMAERPPGLLRPLPAEHGGPTDPPADDTAKAKNNGKVNKHGKSKETESAGLIDPWRTPPINAKSGKQPINDGPANNDPKAEGPDEPPPF